MHDDLNVYVTPEFDVSEDYDIEPYGPLAIAYAAVTFMAVAVVNAGLWINMMYVSNTGP